MDKKTQKFTNIFIVLVNLPEVNHLGLRSDEAIKKWEGVFVVIGLKLGVVF